MRILFSQLYYLVLRINEVIIDVSGFEELLIEDAEPYGKQQLKIFEYEKLIYQCENKQKKCLLLKDFHLEVIIPIHCIEKNCNKVQIADLHVHVHCDENRVYKYHLKLLNATTELSDITDALLEIKKQLKHTFILKICALCKNSNWNPYGGVPFFNHLCFKADKELFWALKNYDKHTVGYFMDDVKREPTYVTYRCEEFLPF